MGLDVLFIAPGNSRGIYQDLAEDYAAVEPPTWALLLAQSCRSVGYDVGICDANAEQLDAESVFYRVQGAQPRLICFVVYGQNVNAGTVNMSGAVYLSNYLKQREVDIPISYVGSHVQAVPIQTLEAEASIDFAFTNEGVYALRNVLSLDEIDLSKLSSIKGVVWRDGDGVVMNPAERVVPADKMDEDLPGYAWDLLPFQKAPLDLYRSPMWHAEYDETKRSPYAAIQTSLGCQFGCEFCMINMINRNDQEEVGVAGDYSLMRHWSADFIINEFDKLAAMGVYTIKITDELFLFNKRYYEPLCRALAAREYRDRLTMWAYSRIDTVRSPELLNLVRSAGIKWLALGIESGDTDVRLEVAKGKFEEVDIRKVVEQIHAADIHVMANYIFGLPGDTLQSMRNTLNLSKELCTLGWNAYAAMPLPGSKLYKEALVLGYDLPNSYEGYSFHGYETQPSRTEACTAAEILQFRDDAFEEYHLHEPFLKLIEEKYGSDRSRAIQEMTKIKLKRRILEKS
jgi:radical SAM superfamily enzyme YgiQ (UPF0313 family)